MEPYIIKNWIYVVIFTVDVGGDIKGDGLQNGGALILDQNGKTLTHFIQNGPAEHLSNFAILKVCMITDVVGVVI